MVYFISGHRDITKEEFKKYYATKIDEVIKKDGYASFVVGDYEGVDIMAQHYLYSIRKEKVTTVYHMFDKPRNIHESITLTKGGYTTDIERDSAMTDASDFDIAYVRKGKWNSGTAQNIKRRFNFE